MRGPVSAWTAVLVLALGVMLSGCAKKSSGVQGPVAAVLEAKGKVILVDLNAGTVLRTVKLRSWALDIEADQGSGTFVTAQSGGVGTEADDKLGIIDVRRGGAVRYVTLPRPNPGSVEVLSGGRVLLDHGWMEKPGMFYSLVDTTRLKVAGSGYVPGSNTPPRVINGVCWSSCADEISGRRSLRRVDVETLQSIEAMGGGDFPMVECATPQGLAGWMVPTPGEGQLARFDAKTGALEATASVDFEDGAGTMVYCRGRLVANDYTGDDISRPGCRLLVFDPTTMKLEREIRMSGAPTDLAVWRDRVVAVNFLDQTLQLVDPATGTIEKTVQLPQMTNLDLKVAVLD